MSIVIGFVGFIAFAQQGSNQIQVHNMVGGILLLVCAAASLIVGWRCSSD